jgi:hypothetical protein
MMKDFLKTTAMAAGIAFAFAGGASSAVCQAGGVTLTEVDNVAFGPVAPGTCFGAETGNLNPADVLAALQNNDWGFGVYDWSYLGKDETGSTTGPVQADVNSSIGDWYANFGSGNIVSVFTVLVKAGNAYSAYLFDISPSTGTEFAGGFNTQLAGLVNNKGTGQGLSHLEVAGVFTGTTPVVPLPAAGWLLLAGVGGLAAMARRRKAAA